MKTDMLFDVPEQKSSRLLWLEKHRVITKHSPSIEPGEEDEFGKDLYPWIAFEHGAIMGEKNIGCGATEHDAIVALAILRGWKLWNEQ